MQTIEIPAVNSRKSAEDELIQFILDGIAREDSVSVAYYHSGCEKGTWWNSRRPVGTPRHKVDCKVIWYVAKAFQMKGYFVNDRTVSENKSELGVSK